MSYVDRHQLRVGAGSAPSVSATGAVASGFEPIKAVDPRRSTWWATDGSTQTWTAAFTSAQEHTDVIAIFAPAGAPFAGTPRVRLRDNVGSTIFDSTVSYRQPAGLPDQRYFVTPTRLTWRYLDVILNGGDSLAYVRYGWAMNLTRFAGRLVNISPNDGAVVQDAPSSAVFAAPDASSGRRFNSYSMELLAIPSVLVDRFVEEGTLAVQGSLFDLWDHVGKADPVLLLPDAEDNTGNVAGVIRMHRTGIYGRLTNDLEFPFGGFTPNCEDEDGNALTDQVLRNCLLNLEGAF